MGDLEPKEPTRATRTNPDPPAGRLAGLSAEMILFSVVASVVGTVLLNLLLR